MTRVNTQHANFAGRRARLPEPTGKKTPGGAGTHERDTHRFKDTGGSRDTHETDTRTSQTNLKTNPTHRLTRQSDRTRRPGTHARHASHHTTPLTRKRTPVMGYYFGGFGMLRPWLRRLGRRSYSLRSRRSFGSTDYGLPFLPRYQDAVRLMKRKGRKA